MEFNGWLNACLMLSWLLGMILTENIYGWVLDQFIVINRKYAISGHQYGMGIMILVMIAALFGILFQLEFRGN